MYVYIGLRLSECASVCLYVCLPVCTWMLYGYMYLLIPISGYSPYYHFYAKKTSIIHLELSYYVSYSIVVPSNVLFTRNDCNQWRGSKSPGSSISLMTRQWAELAGEIMIIHEDENCRRVETCLRLSSRATPDQCLSTREPMLSHRNTARKHTGYGLVTHKDFAGKQFRWV